MTIQKSAQQYLDAGYAIVPLSPHSKHCKHPQWNTLVFHPDDFLDDDNLGIRSVDGVVVVDLDCAEAVRMADAFCPATPAVYGRTSKPRSKRIYTCEGIDKTQVFTDGSTGQTLLELRAEHQDMAPPSVHPDGEVLAWDTELVPPAPCDPTTLVRALRCLATAVLIARYYNPAGNRHTWCLALVGTLRRLELTEEEVTTILTEASREAGDTKLDDRLTEVHATFARPADDPTTGSRTLAVEGADHLPDSLFEVWGQRTDWQTNRHGVIAPNSQHNLALALKKLKVELTYDEFAKQALIQFQSDQTVPLQDAICTRLWLEVDTQFHFRPAKDFFFDVVTDMAMQHPFHPVRDYLNGLVWDGVPRLDTWLIQSGAAGDTPYVRAVSALMLIASVKRVFLPGCKFDEMVVLETGEQGLLKSTALRTLCPNPAWFSDDLPLNVGSKEIVERTTGKWMIEASDLSGMRISQVEQLKGMLSRQIDGPVRLAYARLPVEQPRQFVVIGTTNSYSYLTDTTGNRRFWPIRVERFDITWLQTHRDALWAEATARMHAGESIRLDPTLWDVASLQQDRRRTGDPWEEQLATEFPEAYYRITPDTIWDALNIPIERRDTRMARRIAECMQALGFRRMTVAQGNKRIKGWGKGDTLLHKPKDTV